MTTPNYAALDQGRNFAYRMDKLKIAEAHGYTYITEACHKLSVKYGQVEAAEILEMSQCGLHFILKYMGVVEPKVRGGRNFTKLTEEIVQKAKAIWNGRVDRDYIDALMVVLGVDVSRNAMRQALRGETWADVGV